MTIRNRPDYGVFYVTLTNAGSMDIPCVGSRVVLAAAWQGASLVSLTGGVQAISGGSASGATVNVQIGKALGDAIAMQIGTKVNVENRFDFVRLSWAAQAGVIALVMISDDADGNGVDVSAAPTVSLGTVSIVEGGNTANVLANGALSIDITSFNGGTASNAKGVQVNETAIAGIAITGGQGATTGGSQRTVAAWDQFSIGTSFFSSGVNGVANGATTILAAGSNTNGVSVCTAQLVCATGGNILKLCAGTAAPTSATTNPGILAAMETTNPAVLPEQIFLPAGQGLYLWASAVTTGTAEITYTTH